MIDLAISHKEELTSLYRKIWFNEKYKFYNCANYYDDLKVTANTWDMHQFVSLDKEGHVIGYIAYGINRIAYSVNSIGAINFSNNKYDKFTFGKDAGTIIKEIFTKFHFNKINFDVIIGNPIEESYDRMVKKYGGRIVGIREKEEMLFDNKLYDEKEYEILSENFFAAISK